MRQRVRRNSLGRFSIGHVVEYKTYEDQTDSEVVMKMIAALGTVGTYCPF